MRGDVRGTAAGIAQLPTTKRCCPKQELPCFERDGYSSIGGGPTHVSTKEMTLSSFAVELATVRPGRSRWRHAEASTASPADGSSCRSGRLLEPQRRLSTWGAFLPVAGSPQDKPITD